MPKLSNEKRKQIWGKYKTLQFKIEELATIVQNEQDITVDMLAANTSDTDEIIGGLERVSDMLCTEILKEDTEDINKDIKIAVFKKSFKFEECRSCTYTVGKSKECNTCKDGNGLYELWNADENCEHEILAGNGIRCTKCSGWFCY